VSGAQPRLAQDPAEEASVTIDPEDPLAVAVVEATRSGDQEELRRLLDAWRPDHPGRRRHPRPP
jgi:hypothetical protein